jgi:DNA-directed RNA polymerase subunit RPC12/RpoP
MSTKKTQENRKKHTTSKNDTTIHVKKSHELLDPLQSTQKTPKYVCSYCQFESGNKKDYGKHLSTLKHQKNEQLSKEKEKKQEMMNVYYCSKCSKEYTSRSGLWRHQQQCEEHTQEEELEQESKEPKEVEPEEQEKEKEQNQNRISVDIIDNNENLKNHKNHTNEEIQQNLVKLMSELTPELIVSLIQQNKEMQSMMMEQNKTMMDFVKNTGNNSHNNYNNNNNCNNIQNNNHSFNLNFFLNETCKNAMNMSDFVKNMVVTTDDFEQTGKLGYANGICRILENGLNKLDVRQRPIHCTDVKREIIYIKDNDKWEKDDDNKTKLLGVVKQIGAKNIGMIPQWRKEHPGWADSDSKENDRYLNYVLNSMCGSTDQEIYKNYGDIMRYMCKITVVDKKETMML